MDFLATRDREAAAAPEQASEVAGRLYPRAAAAAADSRERLLDRIRSAGPGLRLARPGQPGHRSGQQGRWPRILALVAAALVLVIVSSTVTAAVMRRRALVEITFVLVAADARSVALAGDFNAWSIDSHPLQPGAVAGSWEITLRLPKGRVYNYNFVIDAQHWVTDPRSPFTLDDGMGGIVSSLIL